MTGESDNLSWSSDADIRSIKQMFPNSYFVKIPGAGHFVHVEKSDDFLSAVVSFLQTEFWAAPSGSFARMISPRTPTNLILNV